jgi:chemotaxis protein methyltransferase CheR
VKGSQGTVFVAPRLFSADFENFSHLMREVCGISFEPHQRETIERRLGQRLDDLGLSSFATYLARLKETPAELDYVFDALMVKETYFFRQDYQLDGLVSEVLPELARREGHPRRLVVWSAGCSSGEEAYTLGILLAESFELTGWAKQVIGMDLCGSNIEAAVRGEYRKSAFRTVEVEGLARHIEAGERNFRVREPLRRMCHFFRGNLLDENDLRKVGRVDVAFCRNVLIYMDEASRLKVLRLIFERLLPGGYLFLGHAESLLSLDTPFEPVHLAKDLVYRRPSLRGWHSSSSNTSSSNTSSSNKGPA